MYEIKAEDVYKDFSNDKEMFNFSNYSTKSKYYDNSNKVVVGKMKDETTDEFLGLKAKKICIWQMIIVSIRRQKAYAKIY